MAGAGTNVDDYFDFICPAKGEIRATRIGLVVCVCVCFVFIGFTGYLGSVYAAENL